MKKKIFHLISGAFLLAFALVLATACGEKSGEKKVLKMATEATFPPYEYRENGEIKGIDVDIVREIAKRNGYTSEVIDMKFDAVITSVQTKKADIAAAGITVTEEIPFLRQRAPISQSGKVAEQILEACAQISMRVVGRIFSKSDARIISLLHTGFAGKVSNTSYVMTPSRANL